MTCESLKLPRPQDPMGLKDSNAANILRRIKACLDVRLFGTAGASEKVVTRCDMDEEFLPNGVLALWCNPASDIPAGWAKADGQNGTFDMSAVSFVSQGNTAIFIQRIT